MFALAGPSHFGRTSQITRIRVATLSKTLGKGLRQWAILDSNQGPPPYQRGALTD
jgi:hypothetical protein